MSLTSDGAGGSSAVALAAYDSSWRDAFAQVADEVLRALGSTAAG